MGSRIYDSATTSEAQSFSHHDYSNRLVFNISNRAGMSQRPRG